MTKKPNFLDVSKKYKLTKIVEDLKPEQFASWDEAASFFREKMGTEITQNHVRTALNTLGKKNVRLVKRQTGNNSFLTILYSRLANIEQRLASVEKQLEELL